MGVRLGIDRIYTGGPQLANGTLTLPDGRFVTAGEAHDLTPVVLSLDENGSCTIPGDVPAADYYFEATNEAGQIKAEGNLKVI